MAESEQMVHLPPACEVEKRIQSYNKAQLRFIGKFCCELCDGVDTVGDCRCPGFVIRGHEMRKRGDGLLHHFQSVVGWRKGSCRFVWRVPGRDENDPIQMQGAVHIAGDVQMAIMDGVEGPA
jgi:hypothetical protein